MKLTIYMKSGNVITLKGVKSWGGTYRGNAIIKIKIALYAFPFMKPKTKLWVGSLDLNQIEAITVTKYFGLW